MSKYTIHVNNQEELFEKMHENEQLCTDLLIGHYEPSYFINVNLNSDIYMEVD